MSAKAKPGTGFLVLLGIPSLGLTFAATTLSAYLPSILRTLTNPLLIGLIIGAEGFFGLFMPVIFGSLADNVGRLGERLKFLWPAAGLMAGALAVMGLKRSLVVIGVMVAVFYIGYYSYLAPYWAIYPDIIPDEYSGRSRSAESIWRAIGAIAALIGGGFLYSLWHPAPFLLAAGLVLAVTFFLRPTLGSRQKKSVQKDDQSLKKSLADIWSILTTDKDIRNLFIANSFWNATLRSILAFTVLFFTAGLHRSHHFVAGVIFPIAAIGIALAAPAAGKLADSFGHRRVILTAALIYGFGDLVPGITQKPWVIAIIPLVSAAAATIMVLPYAMLMKLIDGEPHGSVSGLFGVSRGLGSFAGPVITGAAVYLSRNWLKTTHGYGAFWLAAGTYIIISLFFLGRIRPE